MANDQAYNIYGVVTNTIGVLTAAISLWLWFIYCRLPRSKIQLLECLLLETEKLFHSAIKEGFIDDDDSISHFHERLFVYASD